MDDENLSPPARTPPPFRLWPWARAPTRHKEQWERIAGRAPGVAPDFVVELPPKPCPGREDLLGTMPGVTILAADENHFFIQRSA